METIYIISHLLNMLQMYKYPHEVTVLGIILVRLFGYTLFQRR